MTLKNALPGNQTGRNAWFDNAKAFLIITVVIGHIAECLLATVPYQGQQPIWLDVLMKSIYVFHMPVFMTISGRFSKKRVDRNDWIGVINKLMIPYIVAQTFMILFYNVSGYANSTNISYFKPGFGLWYLLALAVYQLITPHLLKCFKRKWLLLPISVFVAFLLMYQEFAFFGAFQRFFNFFPFFILGYLTADHDFQWCRKRAFRIVSILCFIGLVLFLWRFNHIIEVPLFTGKRVYAQYLELYGYEKNQLFLIMILRYAAGFLFFPLTLGISASKPLFFSHLGTDSSYIYLLHLFIIVALTGAAELYGTLDFCKNDLWGVLLCIAGIPLSFLLVSKPVKKWTRWLVSPQFDLRKIAKKILES